jgi:Putative MetA-pathway of phenol degradation
MHVRAGGIANCFEFLVDTPTYFADVRDSKGRGFSDVTLALKWQISPIPGKVDLSALFGVALPTGSTGIAGSGAQLYLQFPWSWELRSRWGLSGMLTKFFRPSGPASKRITETTFVIEKKLTERASLFVEYVGDYPESGSPAQLLNSGALYRLSPNQQVDFHIAVGLNHNAPSYIGSDIRCVLMSCSRQATCLRSPARLEGVRRNPNDTISAASR